MDLSSWLPKVCPSLSLSLSLLSLALFLALLTPSPHTNHNHIYHSPLYIGSSSSSDALLQRYVSSVYNILRFHLGGFMGENHSRDTKEELTAIEGVVDIVDSLLRSMQTQLTDLALGVKHIFLDKSSRGRVEQTLLSLEKDTNIETVGLCLGHSIYHSRLTSTQNLLVLSHLRARPLGGAKVRTLPVYWSRSWYNCHFIKLHTLVLVVSV